MLFAGLLVAVGAVAFRLVVIRQFPGFGPASGGALVDPARPAARIGRLASLAVVLGTIGRLVAEMGVFRDPFEPFWAEIRLLVAGTSWGRAWLAQITAAALSVIAFTLAARPGRAAEPGWMLAAAGVVLLAYTPALSGHAVGAEHYVTAAITADVLHVAAGGAWLGTLAVMAGVLHLGRRSGAEISRAHIVDWITAFSPLALGSAAVIGATGLFAAWLHLGAFSALWAEPYGRRLSLKLLFVLGVVGCGAYNWKRSRGRVLASGDPARLPPTVVLELAVAVGLLLITAVLTTTTPPLHE
ncbi:copper resistance D family protein [Candidatus Palauibacter sp.]|uniref:copper resistance D family protein n=1 Tax=Candidatus Palauibacter sp. TaxID=3101350 RepID=UPI003B011A44